jgi:DNA-binding beta-propeller fold protein YncE
MSLAKASTRHIGKNVILIAAFAFAIVWCEYSYAATGETETKSYNYSAVLAWGSGGTSDGRFNVPHSIAFDAMSNIYVSDTNNHRIQKFTSDGSFITKWGTEGNAEGQFMLPEGIDIDSLGN